MKKNNTNEDQILMQDNLKRAVAQMLILNLLAEKECYIGELTDKIRSRSNGVLNILFPYSSICRMMHDGIIAEGPKRRSPDGRLRKYYAITDKGRLRLEQQTYTFMQYTESVEAMLCENAGAVDRP